MQIIKSIKHGESETVLVLVVPDVALPSIAEFFDTMTQQYMLGTGVFAPGVAPAGYVNIESTLDGADTNEKILSVFRTASKTGGTMTDGMKRRVVEVLGNSRANDIFGPTWGKDAFSLFKKADSMKLEQLPGGKWKESVNGEQDVSLLNALLSLPGDPPAQPSTIPTECDDLFDTPADVHKRLQELSYQGRDLTDPMRKMINRHIPNGDTLCFPGGRNQGLDLFLKLCAETKPVERGSREYVPNEDFRQDVAIYLKLLGRQQQEVRF